MAFIHSKSILMLTAFLRLCCLIGSDCLAVPAATSTSLSAGPNPAKFGSLVTLTASVNPSTATGRITFYDKNTVLGVSTIVAGQATLKTPLLEVGIRTLRAYYWGDPIYSPSLSSNVSETVKANPSSTLIPSATIPITSAPQSLGLNIGVGDFNSDGRVDIVVFTNASINILLGNSDGSFQPALSTPGSFVTISPGLAIADFDGDGKTDVAIATFGGLKILLGNGDGTLQPPIGNSAGGWLVASDVNTDGKADLVVANRILLSNGDGTFSNAGIGQLTGTAPNVAVADLNNDGAADVIVASVISSEIGQVVDVILGVGDGSFRPPVRYRFGGSLTSSLNVIAVSDFDGDGNLDVAISQFGGFVVALGKGDGTLGLPTPYASPGSPAAITVGDFNGDAKSDLMVVHPSGASIFLGNGNGTFQSPTSYGAGTTPVAGIVADLNGDGAADLIIANRGSNNLSILLAVPSSPPSDLTISKSHAGSFFQGQTGAQYSIVVQNLGGPSVGQVLVQETLPTSLTMIGLAGTGWTCQLNSLSCSRADQLGPGASYPPIVATVNVASNASTSVTNIVVVSGGGETNTANNSANDPTTIKTPPDLTITKTHTGTFVQGQVGATYSISVTNSGGAPTTGQVTLTDMLPSGLTATGINGTGWTCVLTTLSCTRSDALGVGASYPAVALTVNVSSIAPPSVTNAVAVSGGGEVNTANNTATDPTIVVSVTPPPDLRVTKSHVGNFIQGQIGATYSIVVSNVSGTATVGLVTVTDTLPSSLSATAMSGTGWTCVFSSLSCTRSDTLGTGSSYPPITLTASVSSTAPASVTNIASVSGGGEVNISNNTANDIATILSASADLSINVSHSDHFIQGQVASFSINIKNSGGFQSSGLITVSNTLPTGLVARDIAGNGWACNLPTLVCTRNDALASGQTFPQISLSVDVSTNAPLLLTNRIAVSGGGDTNLTNNAVDDAVQVYIYCASEGGTCSFTGTRDVAYGAQNKFAFGTFVGSVGCNNGVFGDPNFGIVKACYARGPVTVGPDLSILISHDGNLFQGQIAASYYVLVSNVGTGATSGSVTVIASFPTGLTGKSLSGNGWSCNSSTLSCNRSDSLQSGLSFPPIVASVDVASNAPSSLAAQAAVSGGGDGNSANNSYSDATQILPNSCSPLSSGIVGWWPADGNAVDLIGGNIGTLQNGASFAPGKAGQAFNFTKGSTAVLVPHNVSLNSADFTLEAWVNYQSPVAGKQDAIVTKCDNQKARTGGEYSCYQLFTDSSTRRLQITLGQSPQNQFISVAAIPLGIWTHVAAVRQGNQFRFYINGALDSTSATTAPAITNTDPLVIGAFYDPSQTPPFQNGNSFGGLIDELAVYNRALSGSEVLAIFSAGASAKCKPLVVLPDLTISKTHTGTFTQGQIGATYGITVSNAGSGTTTGPVSVTDSLPTSLSATSISGPGWTCALTTLTCTRSDVLASGANYPPITLTVNVLNTAPASVTNTVTVSGGSELNAGNNIASDATTITPLAACVVPAAGIVYWAAGDGNTNDLAGGSSGTLTGGATFAPGYVGQAFSFNGINGSLAVPANSSLHPGAITVDLWLKANTVSNVPSIISSNLSDQDGYQLQVDDSGRVGFVIGGNQTRTYYNSSASDVVAGQWTHIAVTYDGVGGIGSIKLYVNGTQRPFSRDLTGGFVEPSGPIYYSGNYPLAVGRKSSDGGNPFNGLVDEVQVFGRALSASEIQGIFAAGSAGQCKSGSILKPDLSITKTHAGNFVQGQTGATYLVGVTNSGTGTTTGLVTVVDTLPPGLTATALSGSGWNCTLATLTCTRADALAAAASYPTITLTVNVASSAPASITNSATVSGGGETNLANNTASDVTLISSNGGITASPSSIDFGNVTLATTSKKTLTITNIGSSAVVVSVIAPIGTGYSLQGLPTLPLTLAANATASFTVAFTPLSATTVVGSVTVTSNAGSPTTTVPLSGVGIPAVTPPGSSLTIATDLPLYRRASPVQISGKFATTGGAGIPNATVNLTVTLKGTARTISAFTDASGFYNALFQPNASDGGTFAVTAVASSGGASQTASTTFRMLGMLLTPNTVSQDLATGSSVSVPFSVQNVSDSPLTNLRFSFTVTPAGLVTATQPQSVLSLVPGVPLAIPVILTTPAGTPPATPVRVVVSFTGTDTISGISEIGTATIFVTLRPAVSTPVLIPAAVSMGINPGKNLTRTFVVRNDGYVPMNNAQVALQNPDNPNWVVLGNATLGTITPGGTAQFQVLVNPPAKTAVGNYSVPFTITGGTTPLQGSLAISVTQLSVGTASFVVSDDIGTKVTGALVTLVGKTNGKSFQGTTDSLGLANISGVDSGDYTYLIAADKHDPTDGPITVTSGSTTRTDVILSFNVVTLTFVVTPTTIVDQYNVTISVLYSTTLPKPALQVFPYSQEFSFFPEDVPNGRKACSLSITNSHPTASVRNLVVDASQLDGGLPQGQRMLVYFPDGTQTYTIGTLAGKGTVNVPCYASLDNGTVPSHAVGNIVVQANYDYSLDGKILQGTTTTNVPVTYTRPADLQFEKIGFTYDKKTDPANPVLRFNGGTLLRSVKNNRKVSINLLKPTATPFNSRSLVAFTNTVGGATILDTINGNQANAFWRTDFNAATLAAGDTTTFDISALEGGLNLTQVLAAEIAIDPTKILDSPSFLAFEGQWSDGTTPNPYLIPIEISTWGETSISKPSAMVVGCLDINAPGCKDPILPSILPGGPAANGTILLAFDQTIRLERQAYNAVLGIGTRTTLTNANASLLIKDQNGNDASTQFFVLITGDPLNATRGGTIPSPTSISWQLIPKAGAGGTLAQGAQYTVQAKFAYTVSGVAKSVNTQAVTITVLPAPQLTLAYSAPFVIMPGKDAKIRVTVKNIGFGVARNLSIQGAQPRIVESLPENPIDQILQNPDPTVDFNIIGASNTFDKTGFTANALSVRFGNVAPGATVSGYWALRTSRKGFFIDISSNMTQTDYKGIVLDPLILQPTTTLVPAIGGTVLTNEGLPMSGLNVAVSQTGSVKGSDVTDQVGNYYIPDLTGGNYLEEVRDGTSTVVASKNIGVLGDQGTNFIDFVINIPTTVPITITSNPAGQVFAVDGQCYSGPQTFQWDFGSHHYVESATNLAVPGSPNLRYVFSGWSDGLTAGGRDIVVGSSSATYRANFVSQPAIPVVLPPGTPGMKISSPPDGRTIAPGDSLSVTIQPDAGITLQKAAAWIPPISVIPDLLQAAPFQTNVYAPTGMLGPATIQAYALDSTNRTLQQTIRVYIESSAVPTTLSTFPNIVSLFITGRQIPLQVSATYPDNTSAIVTGSSFMALSSTNERVASVDGFGRITSIAPGTCSVCANYRGKVATFPVSVGVFSTVGDLDGDGDIDQDDLNILLKVLNTNATGPGDPRDLNKDGRLDALDTRIMTTLCTRARCATK